MKLNSLRACFVLAAMAASFLVVRGPAEAQNVNAPKDAPKGGAKGKGKARPPAGPFTRLPDGKPNMTGYWQTAVFFSAFDLETHEVAARRHRPA